MTETMDDRTGRNKYITSPPIHPVFPATITLSNGSTLDTRQALQIARAVLLVGVEALKQIPGGAKRTVYALERATFHLQRVKIATKTDANK